MRIVPVTVERAEDTVKSTILSCAEYRSIRLVTISWQLQSYNYKQTDFKVSEDRLRTPTLPQYLAHKLLQFTAAHSEYTSSIVFFLRS